MGKSGVGRFGKQSTRSLLHIDAEWPEAIANRARRIRPHDPRNSESARGRLIMMKMSRRLRYWFHSRRIESELSEEIEFHRALKQEQLESSGMSAKDAAAASRRELGNTM